MYVHLGSQNLCGLPVRCSCKPVLGVKTPSPQLVYPSWVSKPLRAASPQLLYVHLASQNPQPTALVPFLVSKPLRAASPQPARSQPEALVSQSWVSNPPAGCRPAAPPILGLNTPADCQPAALVSPCWVSCYPILGLKTPWAVSPHCGLPARSSCKADLGSQNPCRRPARSSCTHILGLKTLAEPILRFNTPSGLMARSSCKPILGLEPPAGCQPAALVCPSWVSKPRRAASPQLL